jgi:hypothetical protein
LTRDCGDLDIRLVFLELSDDRAANIPSWLVCSQLVTVIGVVYAPSTYSENCDVLQFHVAGMVCIRSDVVQSKP